MLVGDVSQKLKCQHKSIHYSPAFGSINTKSMLQSFLLAVIHKSSYIPRCNCDADGTQVRERYVR